MDSGMIQSSSIWKIFLIMYWRGWLFHSILMFKKRLFIGVESPESLHSNSRMSIHYIRLELDQKWEGVSAVLNIRNHGHKSHWTCRPTKLFLFISRRIIIIFPTEISSIFAKIRWNGEFLIVILIKSKCLFIQDSYPFQKKYTFASHQGNW